jgi:hypothetical protein
VKGKDKAAPLPSEEEKNRSERERGGMLTRIVLILGLLFVFYPLSVGPMAKLYNKGVIRDPAAHAIYAPLALLSHRWPACHNLFRWYVHDVWHTTF